MTQPSFVRLIFHHRHGPLRGQGSESLIYVGVNGSDNFVIMAKFMISLLLFTVFLWLATVNIYNQYSSIDLIGNGTEWETNEHTAE